MAADKPKESQGFLRRNAGKLIVSLILSAGIVIPLQKNGLPLVPPRSAFTNVKWMSVPAYLATLGVMSYFRAVRWRFLLRSFAHVPVRRVLAVSWIGFGAILLMPFRIGEIVRPYMLREKGKISMSSATGTVFGERVVDGLYLSIVLAIALLFVPTIDPLPVTVVDLPIKVALIRMYGFGMLGLFTTAFVTIAVFYFARARARALTLAVFGAISKPLGEKLANTAEKLANGLHFLGRGRDAGGFLVETTLYWGINALGMWLLAWGCGVVHADGSPITFGETCAVMGMLGCTILIPSGPGLLGVFQAGIYAGMVMYFPTHVVTGPGAAFVFILWIVQFVWTIFSAGFFLVFDRSAWRSFAESSHAMGTSPESEFPPSAQETSG